MFEWFFPGHYQIFGKGAFKHDTEMLIAKLNSINLKGYTAQRCSSIKIAGRKDWFIPSLFELGYMYENLHKQGLGRFKRQKASMWDSDKAGYFDSYWTSTQMESRGGGSYSLYFDDGIFGCSSYNSVLWVRVCRAF